MALLILGCVACLVSAVTGIQALEAGSRTGMVISYHHGYGRLYAVAAAVFFAVAFYGVYRMFPIVWKLGWIFLVAGTADFIVEAWLGLIHRPYGWVGAPGGYSWRSCKARLLGHLVAAAPRVFHSGRSATRLGARSESSALVCHRHGRSYTHCDCGGVSSEFFSPLRPNHSPQPTADRRGNSRMITSILKFGALLAPVSGG